MFFIFILVILRSKIDNIARLLSPMLKWYLWSPDKKLLKISLQSELALLLNEKKDVQMMDEFAKYSKLQRKIEKVKDKLHMLKSSMSSNYMSMYKKINWVIMLTCNIFFIYLLYYYRYEPVLEFPTDLIYPQFLGKIIAFPIGKIGNVGCVFWILSCQSIVKCFSELLQATV